jgi:hypothetical protein
VNFVSRAVVRHGVGSVVKLLAGFDLVTGACPSTA